MRCILVLLAWADQKCQEKTASRTYQRANARPKGEWLASLIERGTTSRPVAVEGATDIKQLDDRSEPVAVVQRFFDNGGITITHLDEAWVCGEIDLSHEKDGHALEGKFAFPVPAKKAP